MNTSKCIDIKQTQIDIENIEQILLDPMLPLEARFGFNTKLQRLKHELWFRSITKNRFKKIYGKYRAHGKKLGKVYIYESKDMYTFCHKLKLMLSCKDRLDKLKIASLCRASDTGADLYQKIFIHKYNLYKGESS